MKIYTKTGDDGTTSLLHGTRVTKTHPRIRANGKLDLASSYLGLAKIEVDGALYHRIETIQRMLIQVMADIADENGTDGQRVTKADVLDLEKETDKIFKACTRAQGFVLYGKTKVGVLLDVARGQVREAECTMWEIPNIPRQTACYINRLSDYLYVLARKTETNP